MFPDIVKHLQKLLISWMVDSYTISQCDAGEIEMKIIFKKSI